MSRELAILTPAYYERLDLLERRHWWCRSVRRVALDLLDRFAPQAHAIFDAGCGTGGFLSAMAAREPSTRGVGADLSLDALARARGNGLRHLVGASVVELPVASGRIDVVISNDVLQHLPAGEDERALAESFRVLKPGGFLCLRSNLGAPLEPGPLLHRRYDRDSLSRLVRRIGFSIQKHVVLHPLASFWSGRRPEHGHAPSHGHGLTLTLPPAPVNAAIDLYTHVEDAVVRRLPWILPRGDAQIVIAQKPRSA